jgi:hypothetical protein
LFGQFDGLTAGGFTFPFPLDLKLGFCILSAKLGKATLYSITCLIECYSAFLQANY